MARVKSKLSPRTRRRRAERAVSVDDSLQDLLARLGRTLGDALAESEAAAEVVERVRREGLSLYLVLEPRRSEDGSRGIRLVPVDEPLQSRPSDGEEEGAEETATRRRSAARLRRARLRAQPHRAEYRLDQSDVDFLRTLGIDPSRTGRSKSGRGKS